MRRRLHLTRTAPAVAVACVLAGAALVGGASPVGASSPTRKGGPPPSKLAPIHGKYNPKISPQGFVSKVTNPFWPLRPGTAWHYKGVKGKTPQTDNEVVTHKTKLILGIKATVVRDTVLDRSGPVERTFDYYAQDKYGNAWYMGELSLEKKHGHFVKASDSWLAGKNGGKPGIIMPANPQPGDKYRQEYYPPGQALDEATVLSRNGSVSVPQGSYHQHVLVTSEYSPLEPQTEQKYYVAGVGDVKEKVVKGHHEVFRLVRVTH